MGASFPLLQKIALTDLGRIGTRVGSVLLANIAGSAVGSIVTGWIALTYIGSDGSLKLLTATSALFLGLASLTGRQATPAPRGRGARGRLRDRGDVRAAGRRPVVGRPARRLVPARGVRAKTPRASRS